MSMMEKYMAEVRKIFCRDERAERRAKEILIAKWFDELSEIFIFFGISCMVFGVSVDWQLQGGHRTNRWKAGEYI